MIIYKNTINYLDFSGFEKGVLINPFYLFEFVKDDTKAKYYCVCADTSTNKVRHNLCKIVEPYDGDFIGASLTLPIGFYKVNIYEQASSSNIAPTGLTKVETKVLRVIDTVASNQKQYDGYTKTQNVYNG